MIGTPAFTRIPNVLANLLMILFLIIFPNIGSLRKILSLISLPESVRVTNHIDKNDEIDNILNVVKTLNLECSNPIPILELVTRYVLHSISNLKMNVSIVNVY